MQRFLDLVEILVGGRPEFDLSEARGSRRTHSLRKGTATVGEKPLDARRKNQAQSVSVTNYHLLSDRPPSLLPAGWRARDARLCGRYR